MDSDHREPLVYRSDSDFLVQIWEEDPEELDLICPVCGAKVIFASTWELARKFKVHPGAFCTAEAKHFFCMFELVDPEERPQAAPLTGSETQGKMPAISLPAEFSSLPR